MILTIAVQTNSALITDANVGQAMIMILHLMHVYLRTVFSLITVKSMTKTRTVLEDCVFVSMAILLIPKQKSVIKQLKNLVIK
jgi:hypothetical protein